MSVFHKATKTKTKTKTNCIPNTNCNAATSSFKCQTQLAMQCNHSQESVWRACMHACMHACMLCDNKTKQNKPRVGSNSVHQESSSTPQWWLQCCWQRRRTHGRHPFLAAQLESTLQLHMHRRAPPHLGWLKQQSCHWPGAWCTYQASHHHSTTTQTEKSKRTRYNTHVGEESFSCIQQEYAISEQKTTYN